MQTVKRDFYAEVTGKIIAKLEKGVVPWRKSWGYIQPAQNHFTGHRYRGINALLMLLDDYQTPYFATIRQINEAGGTVRKGTKSTSVFFHDCIYKDKNGARLNEEDAKARQKAGDKSVRVYPYLRIFSVFNMQDVDGCAVKPVSSIHNPGNQPLAVVQDFLSSLSVQPKIIVSPSDRAYYDRKQDYIRMPDLSQFESVEQFYAVLFHELTHWAGHPDRLDRKTLTDIERFDDPNHQREELTAQIGTCFLCNRFGIDTPAVDENSASYIQHWLGRMRKDPKYIWDSASDAQAAFAYLMALAD